MQPSSLSSSGERLWRMLVLEEVGKSSAHRFGDQACCEGWRPPIGYQYGQERGFEPPLDEGKEDERTVVELPLDPDRRLKGNSGAVPRRRHDEIRIGRRDRGR